MSAAALLGACNKAAPKKHVSGQLPNSSYAHIMESRDLLAQSICGAKATDGTTIATVPNNPLLNTILSVNGKQVTLAEVVAEFVIRESDQRAKFIALTPGKQAEAIKAVASRIDPNSGILAKLSPESLALLTRYCETGGRPTPTGLIPHVEVGITDQMIEEAISGGAPLAASTSTATAQLGLRSCDANIPCSTNNITPGQKITVTLILNGKDLPISINDYLLNIGNSGLVGIIKTIESHNAGYTVPGTGRTLAADGTVFTIEFTADTNVREPILRALKLYVKQQNNQIAVADQSAFIRVLLPSAPVATATVAPPTATTPPPPPAKTAPPATTTDPCAGKTGVFLSACKRNQR
ncbi:hypothetical protein A3K48_04680 [candidate division WOR-1 bacterium RIFOXYA12_FULL_52_29]|uniref:Uncharacterized protein n=1 Tax=candidate division WOR-1 bacterium RIFOXYC12_FULL_54_18 TaxID=1802584 RepID=A0A1F4T616_UNCSA|nr:MAG: hypothetical protein A3K44_04680 [candidate division WOR-1 bacterium RIFOXYA2_FULL_51_19]OGC17844.1 MAG: hypothetical protein A3K48_04680 [candidate division WOR-1 bacterium RIFOXYA12_FULL_52_29]OGC26701.1 MAG: hypothetical protein A3K32_04675 [candidate division WOR-1 bacterium RIFOXYB2_FULL_45_9]OGC28261.1 MAG: hypothetical protein A3K49_04680 [candidate division WOR-1 bacterium RIFOXYC12_FULL_54_18]OGC31281.1 MAG: hypothetical protein A2346_07940 [candidate division WOR-1 bacterium R